MKLKYYLRGLGIGIIVTTIILMISFAMHNKEMTDSQIIERAEELGMVFPEDSLFSSETEEVDTQVPETENGEMSTETNEVVGGENPVENSKEDTKGDLLDNPENEDTDNASEENQIVAANNGSTYILSIESGDVCRNICDDLYENGVIDDSESFRVYLGSVGYASKMSVGRYEIPYGLTYEEIHQVLLAGPMPE